MDYMLAVESADDGCGFSQEQLADPESLFRPRDGTMHGLGFLWNVASRLGGTVLIGTTPRGGAVVRLLVEAGLHHTPAQTQDRNEVSE